MVNRHAPAQEPRTRTRTRTRTQAAAPAVIVGTVVRSVERNAEIVERIVESRRLPTGVEHAAHVMVKSGVTLSPVQYESVRIDVSISLPSAPTPEAYEAAYLEAVTWVEDKIHEQLESINAAK